MGWWTALVDALQGWMVAAGDAVGGGLAVGILLVVLAGRLLLIPLMLPLAIRTRDRTIVFKGMGPELRALKEQHRKDPDRLHKEIGELHKRHGISVVDGPGLLAALIQLPILIALFQAVYFVTRDTPLAAGLTLVGVLTGLAASGLAVLGLWLGGQADSRPMLALSTLLPFGMTLWLGTGIGLYLIAFYGGSALQGVLMRRTPVKTPERVESGTPIGQQ